MTWQYSNLISHDRAWHDDSLKSLIYDNGIGIYLLWTPPSSCLHCPLVRNQFVEGPPGCGKRTTGRNLRPHASTRLCLIDSFACVLPSWSCTTFLAFFFSMAGVGLGCWVRGVVGSLGLRGLGPRGLEVDSRLCMQFVVWRSIFGGSYQQAVAAG